MAHQSSYPSSKFEYADLSVRIQELAEIENTGQSMAQLALNKQGKFGYAGITCTDRHMHQRKH